jgi:ABC-type multidrug transport system permease subunit
MKQPATETTAALFGFVVGIVFALSVAFGFHLRFWPWCLLVLPAQAVVQFAASVSFYLFFNRERGS